MKILFCHNRYRSRSGEDVAFDYARSLLEADGHRILLFTKDNRHLDDRGALGKVLMGGAVIYSPAARREVYDLARRERPDAALVQNVFPLLSPSIYYGLADAGVPVVQFVFNYRMFCANGQFFTNGEICERCMGGNYLHGLLRRCFRNSYVMSAMYSASLGVHRYWNTWTGCIRMFVVPDEFLGNKLADGGIPREQIRIVHNPFDVDSYQPQYEPGNYALFVGRLIRPKGIFTLLEACLQTDGLRVVVVGDGEEAEAVRRHPAVGQGKAEFVGPAYGSELDALVARSAFVVVPSEWYDNLPMIVCHAFASAKPVIASRINGIPEFVRHQENGLLFSPGDSHGLALAMQHLFTDRALLNKLARGARDTAVTVLSPQKWLTRINALLSEAKELTSSKGSA